MCTFTDRPKLKRPETAKVTAYKVFGHWKLHKGKPFPFVSIDGFKFGWNKWDKDIGAYTGQSGFQVFATLRDAQEYCTTVDIVCPITIKTKDIGKMTDRWTCNSNGYLFEVYEVKSFNLSKRDWNKAKKKEYNRCVHSPTIQN